MLINADFSRRATVTPADHAWVASPQAGVERVMLDRLGGEHARATSLVRYAPGSCFPAHPQPGGEEILVLSGTFSEDDAHCPAGWYLRNPPGSQHQPSSAEGATIFVKLWQMAPEDTQRVRVDTRSPGAWQRVQGREVCPLFSGPAEKVCLLKLAPGEALFDVPVDSAELLVLSGALTGHELQLPTWGWMRLPTGFYPDLCAGAEGATLYLKTGHLAHLVQKG